MDIFLSASPAAQSAVQMGLKLHMNREDFNIVNSPVYHKSSKANFISSLSGNLHCNKPLSSNNETVAL